MNSSLIHKKSRKKEETSVTLFLLVVIVGNNKKGECSERRKLYRVLLDSGSSATLITPKISSLICKKAKSVGKTEWHTTAGRFSTAKAVEIQFYFDEFSKSKKLNWICHVSTTPLLEYEMIMGRDLLLEIGINLLFEKRVIEWEGVEVEMPMRSMLLPVELNELITEVEEPLLVQHTRTRATKILDTVYSPADLTAVVNKNNILTNEEKESLSTVLTKYAVLFDGTLVEFRMAPVDLEIKSGMGPVNCRPFPVPVSRQKTFQNEINHLKRLDVLQLDKIGSPRTSPSFIIPKKDGTVRFLTDFHKVNECLVRKPYPIPKIMDMMQTLQGFTCATTLDLNMGYYTLRLSEKAQRICTIVTPLGRYLYKRLPMGIKCAPDIFQQKMSNLMIGLAYIRTYLDDLLVLSDSTFQDHLNKLTKVFARLLTANLHVHVEKIKFGMHEIEYLGYMIIRSGIKSQQKKIQSILRLKALMTVKEVCSVLGLIQYYRDLWPSRSHTLPPLTELIRPRIPT